MGNDCFALNILPRSDVLQWREDGKTCSDRRRDEMNREGAFFNGTILFSVKVANNPPAYYAEKLYKSMKVRTHSKSKSD